MLTKSKSCPNLFFNYNKKLSVSYGNFLQLNPNASKVERCLAIRQFYLGKI